MDFPKLSDLELRQPPRGWTRRWNNLNQPQALADRELRLKTAINFLRANTPELAHGTPGVVLDLYPVSGELLEVARYLQHAVVGLLSPVLGNKEAASRQLCERQGIGICDLTLDNLLVTTAPQQMFMDTYGSECRAIILRDGFEVVFSSICRYKQSGAIRLRIDESTQATLQNFFAGMQQLLAASGILAMTLPPLANLVDANTVIRELAKAEGLQLVRASDRQLKWRRN